MKLKGRIEVLFGVLCGIWTIGTLLFVLFGPTYISVTSDANGTQSTGSESLVQMGLSPVTGIFFILIGGIALAIGLATLFAARDSLVARILLWILTVSFLPFILLGILSIGPLIFPGFLFALVASVLANIPSPSTQA